MPDAATFLARVSKSLGRSAPPDAVPPPPALDEPTIRLVHSEFGLPELFAQTAKAAKIDAELVSPDDVAPKLAAYARENTLTKIGVAKSKLLEALAVPETLRAAGVDLRYWEELAKDELYDLDAGLTDAFGAVAETGSIAIRSSPVHGRSLSLVPPVHIAVIEPKVISPDLFDFFNRLQREGVGTGTVLITGPSKTADIEMNLVTGVHGPGVVKAFVLK
jgi:L-lactate dehydrogenase complex protein LldG